MDSASANLSGGGETDLGSSDDTALAWHHLDDVTNFPVVPRGGFVHDSYQFTDLRSFSWLEIVTTELREIFYEKGAPKRVQRTLQLRVFYQSVALTGEAETNRRQLMKIATENQLRRRERR